MRKTKYIEKEFRGYEIPDKVDEFIAWIKTAIFVLVIYFFVIVINRKQVRRK